MRELSLILGGYAFFETLASACHLDLFTFLSGPPAGTGGRTRREIAAHLGLPEHPTRLLMNTCLALRLVERGKRGKYRNCEYAEELLVRHRPHNLLAMVEAAHQLHFRPMYYLRDALRTGKNEGLRAFPGSGRSLYGRLAASPKLERVFHEWLRSVSQHSNQKLASIEELEGAHNLLDVGGGTGTNAFMLAERFPHLRITILDLASVCTTADKEIASRGLSRRISTLARDFFRDPMPKGFDAILLAHLLTNFSEDKNIRLLKKCHRALPEGGVLINLDDVCDDEEADLDAAKLSLYFLAITSGEGMVHPWEDYARWFAEAGFGRVREYKDLPGVIVARKRITTVSGPVRRSPPCVSG